MSLAQAWEERFEEYFDQRMMRTMRRWATSLVRSADDGDDVVQSTLLLAWTTWRREWPYNPGGWVRHSLVQQTKQFYRLAAEARRDLDVPPWAWQWSYEGVEYAEAERREAELLESVRESLGASDAATAEDMLVLLDRSRDPGRGQTVLRRRGKSCRQGHLRTPENTRYSPDGTLRCLECARASKRRAREEAARAALR